MYEVFTKLLNMSIMASVLAVFVMLLRLILKKVPRKYICILWALVAIRLIIPMGFFSNLSFYNVMDVPTDESGQIEYFQYTSHAEKPEIVFTVPAVGHEEYAVGQEVTTSHTEDLYLPVIINIWIIGFAVMILSALISFFRLKGEVAASVRKEGRIYTCDDISFPFILGIIMPRIYIPSGMPDEIREHVIAHEQAHLRRLDHLWKPLGFFILSIHWFNPVIWVSYILLCRDIEAACDEKVISGMDKEKISGYSEALLTCATHRRLITACPVAFGETDVKSRVKNVLNYKKPAFWVIIIAVIACIVVAVCFLTNPTVTNDPADITGESALYEPPVLMVIYNGKEYKRTFGSCSWMYYGTDGMGHGVNVDSEHPLFMKYTNDGLIDMNDSVGHMWLSFAREPESVYVRYWSENFMNDPDSYEDNYSEASYDPETGEIGFQTGSGLIFEVKGTWPEGTACYSFYLTMEGGSESRLTSSEGTVTEVVGAQAVVVYTVYAGTVTEVGYDNERGNYVIITDQYGNVSGYDHLSEVYVYEGLELNVGAAVGNRYFDIGIDNPIGLTMSVKTVRPGGCDLVFEQSGVSVDGSLITGCAYDLQQLNESREWVSFFPETLAWNEIAYDILKGTTTELSVTWEVICGQLPAGHYRIVKSVMHFKTDGGYDTYLLYAEFDMGNSADGNQNVEVIFSNESQEFSEVRFIEEKNDEEESSYRVETDLLATDFSVISESLSDMIKQEWNRWDNMTSEQRMLSSSIPGMIFFDCETWTECEETIGLTIYNPLEGFDWLEKVGYFGMEVPDISHVQAMANASSQINGRELNEITITSGYNSEGIRITLMAVVSSRDDIYTIGSRYSGMATYDHKTGFTGSGIPVLVVITDGQNNLGYYNGDYYDPTAYWVRDNVFYTLRVTGDKSEEKEIQELFDKIISEV